MRNTALARTLSAEPPKNIHKTSTLFIRELSNEEHGAFKAACARRGRTMKGIVLAFMRDVNGGSSSKGVVSLAKLSAAYPANSDNPK